MLQKLRVLDIYMYMDWSNIINTIYSLLEQLVIYACVCVCVYVCVYIYLYIYECISTNVISGQTRGKAMAGWCVSIHVTTDQFIVELIMIRWCFNLWAFNAHTHTHTCIHIYIYIHIMYVYGCISVLYYVMLCMYIN